MGEVITLCRRCARPRRGDRRAAVPGRVGPHARADQGVDGRAGPRRARRRVRVAKRQRHHLGSGCRTPPAPHTADQRVPARRATYLARRIPSRVDAIDELAGRDAGEPVAEGGELCVADGRRSLVSGPSGPDARVDGAEILRSALARREVWSAPSSRPTPRRTSHARRRRLPCAASTRAFLHGDSALARLARPMASFLERRGRRRRSCWSSPRSTALVWANSPWSASYDELWSTPIDVTCRPVRVRRGPRCTWSTTG